LTAVARVLFGGGLVEGEELYVAKAGGIESGRERAGEKSQALAGFRGIDETGEDGLAVVGEDFDGVFIDDDLDAY
jgi:hypothetical protein